MSKFKVLEEGRINKDEMSQILGGINKCPTYDLCNNEHKHEMPGTRPGTGIPGGGGGDGSTGDHGPGCSVCQVFGNYIESLR